MTPTQAYAIVRPDGHLICAYPTKKEADDDADMICAPGSVVTPVTIIPTADLMREAARVLLDWFGDPDENALRSHFGTEKVIDAVGAMRGLTQSLRALAKGDTP